MDSKNNITLKVFTTLSFIIMLAVNALAVILPINNTTPGQISDSYKNLFAPAGSTFAIWGVIYLLLAFFVLYQLGIFQVDKSPSKVFLLERVRLFFIISSIANAAWIFSWHYRIIPLSMVLMLVMLTCLILIAQEMKNTKLLLREKFFVRLPFSIYFGWITVATIANATVLLVSLGWNGFGISEQIWTVAIILVGLLIGIFTTIKNRDIAYGLVIVWGYAGIYLKHTSPSGFAGQYPSIINTVIISIVLLFIAEAYVLFSKKAQNN